MNLLLLSIVQDFLEEGCSKKFMLANLSSVLISTIQNTKEDTSGRAELIAMDSAKRNDHASEIYDHLASKDK